MIIKCASCKCEIVFDEEQELLWEEAGFYITTQIWCDDCLDGMLGTRQDRAYDEGVGK